MTSDPQHDLISALRSAALLASAPDVKLQLAELLLDLDAEEALEHTTAVLRQSPDHFAALELAARICTRLGRDEVAGGYRRMADSLRHVPSSGETAPTAASSTATPPGSMPSDLGDLDSIWHDAPAPVEPPLGSVSRPTVTLADVAGMADVKRYLNQAFFAPLRNPELALAFRKQLRGGLLLWGPPGCGKTFLARAVAGELGAAFYSVGIADVLDMWVGSSERNLRDIFRYAREHAPCVLFFDELDALGQKRAGVRSAGTLRSTINHLLAELDGFGSPNDGVFVLGATNHPWDLDEAIVRPGRFDRTLLVLPPEAAARAELFESHLRDRPVSDFDRKSLVNATDGWSGADVAHLCESAAALALAESLETDRLTRIGPQHFKVALREVRPSMDSWMQVARNYVAYSNADGRLDGLVEYLGRRG